MELRRINIAVNVSTPRTQRSLPNRLPTGFLFGGLRQSCIQLQQAPLGLIDRQQIFVHHRPLGRVCPFEAIDPLAVRAGPVAPE